jgi:hypothetical protein
VLEAALLGQPSQETKLGRIRFSNPVDDNRLCSGLLCRFVHPRPLSNTGRAVDDLVADAQNPQDHYQTKRKTHQP